MKKKPILRKRQEMKTEVRENMRGGMGKVTVRHLFVPDEIIAKTRLCAMLTVHVGASIGIHKHENEDELFVILSGSGLLDDGNQKLPITAGDSILTGNGAEHSIVNTGAIDMEIVAVIMSYPPAV
jgi:mannose-6-phosphate isomerase-like protein (cupin superfamily)